ncbi:hypothetical protein CsSME_00032065 [Camellia sinensis var. sinensis]
MLGNEGFLNIRFEHPFCPFMGMCLKCQGGRPTLESCITRSDTILNVRKLFTGAQMEFERELKLQTFRFFPPTQQDFHCYLIMQDKEPIEHLEDDEAAVLQGEKETEKMIVEAYAALLAFLSTESNILHLGFLFYMFLYYWWVILYVNDDVVLLLY